MGRGLLIAWVVLGMNGKVVLRRGKADFGVQDVTWCGGGVCVLG